MKKAIIDKLEIVSDVDEFADLSYLGEFTDKYTEDCIIRNPRELNRHDYKYFLPTNTYKEHKKGLQKLGYSKGMSDYLARSYVYQDYRRYLDCEKGNWQPVFVYVKALVKYPIGNGNYRLEYLKSGGIAGIESDDRQGIFDIVTEEFSDLKSHLQQFNVNIRNFYKLAIQARETFFGSAR